MDTSIIKNYYYLLTWYVKKRQKVQIIIKLTQPIQGDTLDEKCIYLYDNTFVNSEIINKIIDIQLVDKQFVIDNLSTILKNTNDTIGGAISNDDFINMHVAIDKMNSFLKES